MGIISFAIVLHLVTVIPALIIGLVVLFNQKGTRLHKRLGRFWAGLIVLTSIVSFFITHNGQFSAIHILSVISIASVLIAIHAIRHGNVLRHKRCMIGAYIGSVVAGIFATILPGRFLYTVFFG